MIETGRTTQQTEAYVRFVQGRIAHAGDAETARRIGELADRLASGSAAVSVAFCGLFSAGKSSLLNALTQTEALATGAVPTTAEIAELVMPNTHDSVILLDTPGVDSTDPAHQAATEAALHRADVIVLVMDYQHVEAESNLELARSFCEQRKRLVLVVNQVDKHLDWELPFAEFQDRVLRTLDTWDITPERIFYTATLPCEHNELDALKAYLTSLPEDGSTSIAQRVLDALRDLVEQHVDRQMAERQTLLEQALTALVGIVPYDREEAERLRARLVTECDERRETLEAAASAWAAERDRVREALLRSIELAQISPYDTTERGRLFIESLRPDFRPGGWFRAKQRAEEEQARRLRAFVDDLSDHVQKYLVWPLQASLRELVKEADWTDEAWLGEIDMLTANVTEEDCRRLVKSGALVSDQYPYQYVKDVVAAVKRNFSGRLADLLDHWFERAQAQMEAGQAPARQEIEGLQAQIEQISAWIDLQAERERQVANILSMEEEDKASEP
ncbi:dynamin family protein [Alicyclobacillus cycloheptanicus]|uniref:Small GTP-binding protein n=1 Tax=Alicyclobacillus cycloheptanicus TaxID=1457 RepID=A0ABT9XI28_9BACL|nr:dynamin family protein [Alicyclobacillus cycloheptanicus]MDQ0189967.1 small GTP-binding protein [Alicyclobacillus cycloheptanicus]WDM00120.1 dynamin family protein [Alicyclobacillus cycloheptanicus]